MSTEAGFLQEGDISFILYLLGGACCPTWGPGFSALSRYDLQGQAPQPASDDRGPIPKLSLTLAHSMTGSYLSSKLTWDF